MTRIVLYSVTVFLLAYDLYCMVFGIETLSHRVRASDEEVGGLIRFGLAALWLHWFCPLWRVKNGI